MPPKKGFQVYKQHQRNQGLIWWMIIMMLVNTACTVLFGKEAEQPLPGIDLLPGPPLRSGISGWRFQGQAADIRLIGTNKKER